MKEQEENNKEAEEITKHRNDQKMEAIKKLLKVVPISQSMNYIDIAEVVGKNLEDYMFDCISPYPRNKFNGIYIKRVKNQLQIGYCKYDEFYS